MSDTQQKKGLPMMTAENWREIIGALQIHVDFCKEHGHDPNVEDLAFIAMEDDYDWSQVYPDRV